MRAGRTARPVIPAWISAPGQPVTALTEAAAARITAPADREPCVLGAVAELTSSSMGVLRGSLAGARPADPAGRSDTVSSAIVRYEADRSDSRPLGRPAEDQRQPQPQPLPLDDLKPHRWGTGWRRRQPGGASVPRSPARQAPLDPPLTPWEPVNIDEARALSIRFAADYLSWDELDPACRASALRTYLVDPALADVGWHGRGRQRADLVTAGRTLVLGEGRVVVVEVTARVVSYRRVAAVRVWRTSTGEMTPPLAFAPASAPAPTAPGWESGASWWVRIAPPVRRDHDGRLVVDLALDLTDEP